MFPLKVSICSIQWSTSCTTAKENRRRTVHESDSTASCMEWAEESKPLHKRSGTETTIVKNYIVWILWRAFSNFNISSHSEASACTICTSLNKTAKLTRENVKVTIWHPLGGATNTNQQVGLDWVFETHGNMDLHPAAE